MPSRGLNPETSSSESHKNQMVTLQIEKFFAVAGD